MQNQSDAQLLRDYAADGSEPAFAGIVVRHTDLVYSAAWRQTGSPELAREIAQTVFTDLARKARALAVGLTPDASLTGWLYRSTRYEVLTVLRDERRRQAHQRLVMEHFNPAADPAPDWQQIAPVLDEAMAELGDADREAVLLRYFQNQDFQAVGRALGVSDDTAQKRVSRAVERLREFLAQRGVTLGAQGLVVVLAANAVQAAPAGLSAALAAAALAGTAVLTTATATVGKAIAMTTTQKVLVTSVLAAAVGTGIYEARQASNFRKQLSALEQQQAALTEQLTRDHDEAARQLATLRGENDRLNRNTTELLKLRSEVTTLRRENAGLAAARANAPAKSETPETTYAAIGAATPEAGLQRLFTASKLSDTNHVPGFLGWRIEENVPPELMSEELRAGRIRDTILTFSNTSNIRIVNQQMENNDLVRARVEAVELNGRVRLVELILSREGDEWKPALNVKRSRSGSYSISMFFPLTPGLGPTNQ